MLLDETGLTEIEIERDGLRVRVARTISVAAAGAGRNASAIAGPPAAGADLAKHPGVVPSPMVGTAYLAAVTRRQAVRRSRPAA